MTHNVLRPFHRSDWTLQTGRKPILADPETSHTLSDLVPWEAAWEQQNEHEQTYVSVLSIDIRDREFNQSVQFIPPVPVNIPTIE